ncbi:MAG: hydroxymethylbilane synthase [Gemmataceae bacterium]
MTAPLRIGTRGSPLALWQANHVADQLRGVAHGRPVELVIIQTQGDQVQNRPLNQIGGDGVFTKAIQDAILAGRADVAVHSLKDLPTEPVAGLKLAAVPPRGPTGDAFVSRKCGRFDDLPEGARVATGSTRRRALLRHRRPDLRLEEIRGNVETRLRKLTDLDLDGLILAQAGLERLGLAQAITESLDQSWMLPAVGQGALGLECRTDDAETQHLLSWLDDPAARQAVMAERAFLLALGGGCQMPIAAAGRVTEDGLQLRGAVLSEDGARRIDGDIAGPAHRAEQLGIELAQQLLKQGAKALLG